MRDVQSGFCLLALVWCGLLVGLVRFGLALVGFGFWLGFALVWFGLWFGSVWFALPVFLVARPCVCACVCLHVFVAAKFVMFLYRRSSLL